MKITHVKALPGFCLELQFDNRETGVVDLSEFAGRGVCAAWTTPGVFEQAAVTDDGAIEWPGEVDMCPDALYLRMTGKTAEEVFAATQSRGSHA
jgi:hypothetical protein